MVCGTNYTDIAFSCTNTTFVDSNGDADGVTVFVATDCGSNDRLSLSQQDVKYSSLNNNVPLLFPGTDDILTNSNPALAGISAPDIGQPTGDGVTAPDPNDIDTCDRGCICGYSPNKTQIPQNIPSIHPAYSFCECEIWLHSYLSTSISGPPYSSAILVTAANISLFDHYSVNYTGLVTTNSSTDNVEPLQSPFECFGNPLTVAATVFQYVDLVGSYDAGR